MTASAVWQLAISMRKPMKAISQPSAQQSVAWPKRRKSDVKMKAANINVASMANQRKHGKQ